MSSRVAPDSGTANEQGRVPRGAGREALLDALVRVGGREGLAGITHRSVAAEAGVTHGLASYHFASRDEMVSEALVCATRNAMERTGLATGASLDQLVAELSRQIDGDPWNAGFQFDLAIESLRRPELRDEVRSLYDQYVTAMGGLLAQLGLGDDAVLARLVFAAVDGLVLQQLIYGAPSRTDECLERLRQILTLLAERASDQLV